MTPPFLECRKLRKNYGATVALDGVSLAVERGELFGLLGPNGAGKTTLLSILGGLLDAENGDVFLKGAVFHREDRQLRRLLGFGTQDLALYPELTARENLVFFGRLYGLERKPLAKRVGHLLHAVGLSDRAGDRAGTFSGGMKRRLNLAVAVIHEPQALFLDEPTTGVDPQSRHHIYELVKTLNADGMTIIYTSHYMEEVQALCPRIAIIDRGRVLACRRREDFLKMLDATLTLDGVSAGDEAQAAFAALRGVKSVVVEKSNLVIVAEAIAPLLPGIAEVCRQFRLSPRGMTVAEPTLERVFLHLTGHTLRD